MKQVLIIVLIVLSVNAFADNTEYKMRVDGLACPYCAYGIEKKLTAIEGIEGIDVDLEKGLVIVVAADGVVLSEKKMEKLFQDSGFTFRSMEARKVTVSDEK